MGIGYNVEANDGELYNCPGIYCDWCERPIEDARNGNVYWYHDRPETLYFNHKWCAWQYDNHLKARAGGSTLLSEELDLFLVHLLGNTGIVTDEDWRRLRRLA